MTDERDLAALSQAEPVADGDRAVLVAGDILMQHGLNAPEQQIFRAARSALLAAAPYLQAPVSVEGWKLVPIEPTEAMLFAADWLENGTLAAYRAMLAAAPLPAPAKEER